MSNSNDKAIKSGLWYVIGNFLTKGIGFITTPIFTRLMTKADVGDFSNFTSWISILSAILTLDLFTSVTLAKYDFENNLDDYITSNLLLGSFVTGIFYCFSFFFKDGLLSILGINELEYHVMFLYLLVYPATQMIIIKSRMYYKYKLCVFLSLLSAISSTLISLLLVIFVSEQLTGRIIGNYIPLILINLFIYAYYLVKHHKIEKKYWLYALKISTPLIIHTLSGSLLGGSDRVMINYFCGKEATAYYSIAYTCGLVVTLLWSSLNSAWSPWAYDMMKENNSSSIRKASKPFIIFFGIVVLGMLLFGPELLLLMGGESYAQAISVIPPLMLAYVFQFVYSLYVNIETFYKKQWLIALGTFVAAVINVILNYVFIPIYGYPAAAYTTLIGYVALFLIHYIFVKLMKKNHYYSNKFIIIFLVIFSVLSLCVSFTYALPLVRYIIIGAIMCVFFVFSIVFRKELINLIRKKSLDGFRKRFGSKNNIKLQ